MKDEVDHVNDESFDGNVPGSDELLKQQREYEYGITLFKTFLDKIKSKSLTTGEEQEAYFQNNYNLKERTLMARVWTDLQIVRSKCTPEMLGE